jgi:negative regulator of sigma E activity
MTMNSTYKQPTVSNEFADVPPREHEHRAPDRTTVWAAVFVLAAVALSGWLVYSTGVPHVSAAASDESAMPQVPYFPSQYINQASEPSAVPPTF